MISFVFRRVQIKADWRFSLKTSRAPNAQEKNDFRSVFISWLLLHFLAQISNGILTLCVCVCVLCNGPALSCDVRRMTNRAGFSSESLGSSFLFPTLSSFKTSIKHLQQLLLLLHMPNNKYRWIHLWLIQTGEGGRLYGSLIKTGKIVIRSLFYCEGQRRLSSKPPTNKKRIKMIINGDNWIKLSK